MGLRLGVYAFGLRLRVGGHCDRFASAAGHRCYFLPKLFRDKGNQRMRQAQHRLQGADQGAAGGALLRCAAVADLHFGDLQIPVAELIPNKVIDGVGHVVQAVLGKAGGDQGFDFLQLRDDPAVGLAEAQVLVERAGGNHLALRANAGRLALRFGVFLQAAVIAFAVHQHEAAGVPELVAKVAVTLAALGVKVDVAPQTGQCGKGEAQRISAVGRDTLGEFLLRVFAHLRRGLGLAQALAAFVQQGLQGDAIDQIHRVEHIALGLTHLLALRIAHQTVDVHMLERNLACEVRGHHDHAGDPEEDDVVAGDQHAAGQVQVVVLRFFGPSHGGEGHQCAGVPGIEHVLVAAQDFARGLGLRFSLIAGDIDPAVFVVPRGDLVAPPELAADAPVLDVVHPLVVGVDPVFGHELHRAALHSVYRLLRDRLAAGVLVGDLGHRYEPLVGEHGLDDLAGARADGQHQLVRLHFKQQSFFLQISQQRFARDKAVHTLVVHRAVVVDLGVQREDGDQWQTVALRAGIVVEVVRAGDLDATRAKGAVHKVVGNDGNFAVAQRQVHHLAEQVDVALVLRVHSQRAVGHHGLRPCGGNRHAFLQHAINQLRPV